MYQQSPFLKWLGTYTYSQAGVDKSVYLVPNNFTPFWKTQLYVKSLTSSDLSLHLVERRFENRAQELKAQVSFSVVRRPSVWPSVRP